MTKQVTKGKTWRKSREEGVIIELPSGNTAKLRPVALDLLILSGKLPDLLTPIAAKTLWTDTDMNELGNIAEQAKGFAELVNIVVKASVMYPIITNDPQNEDEVSLDDIDFSDKISIFQLATQPVLLLKTFRLQQEGNVEALFDSENGSTAL